MPWVCATVEEIRQAVGNARKSGQTIALVPTMGALHDGHTSLMKKASETCDFTVVSIFVNPTQFGPNEDFARYPRALEKDIEVCASERVHVIFAPKAADMFPSASRTFVEVAKLQDVLCGVSRPGHFRGVATVVLKLFNIVQPDLAFFGQKDAQQVRILERMTADLNLPVGIVVCPIVREPDGLALSSRNQYLDADQRQAARALHQSLQDVVKRVIAGERTAAVLVKVMKAKIEAERGARLEYAAVVDADSLEPMQRIHGKVLVALAVWFGSTRLIDNVLLNVDD
jgi:pantoate--beta-alanine ligase